MCSLSHLVTPANPSALHSQSLSLLCWSPFWSLVLIHTLRIFDLTHFKRKMWLKAALAVFKHAVRQAWPHTCFIFHLIHYNEGVQSRLITSLNISEWNQIKKEQNDILIYTHTASHTSAWRGCCAHEWLAAGGFGTLAKLSFSCC